MDHLDLLALGKQVQGAVHGLGARAADDHALAQLGGGQVVKGNHGHVGATLEAPLALAAHGHDHDLGGLGGHGLGGRLGAEHHVHAVHVELVGQVVVQVAQTLMVALVAAGHGQQAAQGAVLLEQRHAVAALGGNAGGLHAGRAAADHNDLLGDLGGQGLIALGHGLGVGQLGRGVHAAVLGAAVAGVQRVAALVVAVHAMAAGSHLFAQALLQLVGQLGVDGQRAGHHEVVDLAVGHGVGNQVGSQARVHAAGARHGLLQVLLELGGALEQHRGARVVGQGHAAKVLREVEAGAEAREALALVAREHQVGGKLRNVLARHRETQVERVGAGSLKGLGVLDGVLNGDEHVVVADERVVVFHGVHENLDRKVLAAGLLDSADGLAGKAGAVLDRLGAVLVLAGVEAAREHVLHELGGRAVQLDDVEAGGLIAQGDGCHGVLQPLEVLDGGVGNVGGTGGQLDAGVGALVVDALGQRGELGADGLGGELLKEPAGGGAALFVDLHRDELADSSLHEHERRAALGEVAVVVEEAVVHAAVLGAEGEVERVGAGGALDIAVLEGQRTDLQRLVERREVGGVGQVGVALRVQDARLGRGSGGLVGLGSAGSGNRRRSGGGGAQDGGPGHKAAARHGGTLHRWSSLDCTVIPHGQAASAFAGGPPLAPATGRQLGPW